MKNDYLRASINVKLPRLTLDKQRIRARGRSDDRLLWQSGAVDKPPHRPTSADVARQAGTSRATVSYVLNNTPSVTISEATRQRVLQAAQQLNYVPSIAARSLASGRSDLVLMLMPDAPLTSYAVGLIHAIHETLRRHAMMLHVYFTGPCDVTADELGMASLAHTLVAIHPLTHDEQVSLTSSGMRVLAPNAEDPSCRLDIFTKTDYAAGQAIGRYLLGRGHTKLAFVTYNDPRRQVFSAPRLQGLSDACQEAGTDMPSELRLADEAGPRDLAPQLLAAGCTGIATYNDDIALAVMSSAVENQIADQMQVVGGNDVSYTPLAFPRMSTLHRDVHQLAEVLVNQLVGQPSQVNAADLVRIIDRAAQFD